MADIQTTRLQAPAKGVVKLKKSSTRVDLTPMVDLGFLLITFFIFTTTMASPTAMKLILPNDENAATPSLAPASQTITFLLGGDEKVFYYDGLFDGTISKPLSINNGMRQVLQHKMQVVLRETGSQNKTIVLIKASADAKYKNIVDALDEMVINGVTRYVLLDVNEDEIDAMGK